MATFSENSYLIDEIVDYYSALRMQSISREEALNHKAYDEQNVFQELIHQKYIYNCKELYLGKEGNLISPDGNIILHWFYTVRDGIFFQAKRSKPYAIIFEYSDGGYYINDNRDNICKILSAFRMELDKLRDEIINGYDENVFIRLERIIMNILIKPTDDLNHL